MLKSATILATVLTAGLALAGCHGVAPTDERRARADLAAVQKNYRHDNQPPPLPALTNGAGMDDFLHFAILNHPLVEAAFYDWSASVERITVERSLPDPTLTFETYIANSITSLMPGLMMNFPGPGKLGARAAAASAESRAKYFQFESGVLQTAFAVKKTAYPLLFLDEEIRVDRQTLALVGDLEILSRAQNEVGKATLQDVLRAQIEQERLRTEIVNLEDSRHPLMAQFRAALGLKPGQPDPPLPILPTASPFAPDDNQLLALALAQNPRLKEMEAEIRSAEAEISVARKDQIPDFSAGFEADVKASPVVWNPQFSMTLPVWRDKIAAEIRAAEADKHAAEARLTVEQIGLAADFAGDAFMVREADRELDLIRNRLLPRARQSLEVSRAAYRSGQVDFLNVIDAERTLLELQLDEIAMKTQRETAVAELSLVVAGIPPADAPLLTTSSANSKPTP
jgi:outer membrane protein TolC